MTNLGDHQVTAAALDLVIAILNKFRGEKHLH
jgi:hypothetical protein